MLLARLPRLRDRAVRARGRVRRDLPRQRDLRAARGRVRARRSAGRVPSPVPCEIYCHSLTDPSILGPGVSAQTLTLFALHTPARLFERDRAAARREALAATLRSLDAVLAEPIEDCLLRGAGRRARAWRPRRRSTSRTSWRSRAATSSTATSRGRSPSTRARRAPGGRRPAIANVQLCGAGARRGGGVSGIPGRNAAMAVLGR